MSLVLTGDLAAKFSAFTVGNRSGEAKGEFDSWGLSAFAVADRIAKIGRSPQVDLIVLENVPMGIQGQAMVKPPFIMQGLVFRTLGDAGCLDKVLMLDPSKWQRAMGCFGKATPSAIEVAKRDFDYDPPDMLAIHEAEWQAATGKDRSTMKQKLKKATTDYADAFLIYKYVLSINLRAGETHHKLIQPVFF